jgi:hypothetical protein
VAMSHELRRKEAEWAEERARWEAKERRWLGEEARLKSAEGEWHAKEADYKAREMRWQAKEAEWAAREAEWQVKEADWSKARAQMEADWNALAETVTTERPQAGRPVCDPADAGTDVTSADGATSGAILGGAASAMAASGSLPSPLPGTALRTVPSLRELLSEVQSAATAGLRELRTDSERDAHHQPDTLVAQEHLREQGRRKRGLEQRSFLERCAQTNPAPSRAAKRQMLSFTPASSLTPR